MLETCFVVELTRLGDRLLRIKARTLERALRFQTE